MFGFAGDAAVFQWVILPVFIFAARIVDVTLGTLRIIFISRGRRLLAPLMGFFEVLIWLLAISQIFQNLRNPACYIAYAAGFAGGSFVGMVIENRLAIGLQIVRIITKFFVPELIAKLKAAGYGLTTLQGEGASGPVTVIFTIVKRRDLPGFVDIIQSVNPKVFYTVEDVRMAKEGVYPLSPRRPAKSVFHRLLLLRKGK